MRTTIKTILLIAVLALLAASCSTAEAEESAAAEKAAATQGANTEAWLAHDIDALMATYTEDIEFTDEANGAHPVGKAQMESLATKMFDAIDPDASDTIVQFVSGDGTNGVVNTHWVGQNPYGAPIDLTYVFMHEFESGLISKVTVYWENREVYQQLHAQPDS